MKFISLHASKNTVLYVNSDMIIVIQSLEKGSYLHFRDSRGRNVPGFSVLESPEEIIAKIEKTI